MKQNQTRILLIVLAVALIGVIGFFAWPKGEAVPGTPTATSTETGTPAKGTTGTKPATGTVQATPAIPLSKVLQNQGGVVSLYDGVDPSGRPVYKPIAGADAATFKALTAPVVVETPSEKNGSEAKTIGEGSVAYYKDKNFIYLLSTFQTDATTKVGIHAVQNTDLATFTVLKDNFYATDKGNVFALDVPGSATPYAAGSYVWKPYDMHIITNAEVKSFVLVSSGAYDAHDATHKYRRGVEVGTYPQ